MSRTFRILGPLILAALLLTPAVGDAREYVVYSCKLPDGRPAPADGWRVSGGASYAWFDDACGAGGPLAAGMAGPAQTANATAMGWSFDSGPASILGYSIARSGRISGGGYGATMFLFSADGANSISTGHLADWCTYYTGCTSVGGLLVRSAPQIGEDSHQWHFTIGCGGSGGAICTPIGATDFGRIAIDSARFRLDDAEQPTVESASGSLAVAGGALSVTATDQVSGVASAQLEVDGVAVASDRAGGERCRPIGAWADGGDYAYRRPCPPRWTFELPAEKLAAQQLVTGSHTVRVRVLDAAGNAVTAFGPERLTLGTVSATGAGDAQILLDTAAPIVTRYGRRVRIAGRLTGAAAGERISLALRSAAAARALVRTSATTTTGGQFEFFVRAHSSRVVELAPSAGSVLRTSLKVKSPLVLKARGRRVPPLGRLRLSGRIPAERARRSASVAIRVRSTHGWRTVGVVRASKDGHFSFAYRLRRTHHADFVFRAVAIQSGDLTVAALPSKPVRVRVG